MSADLGFIAWGNRLVVKPDEAPEKVGDLFIPEKAKVRQKSGKLLALGTEVPANWSEFIGRTVLFHGGVLTSVNDAVFLIMAPEDVLGILPEEVEASA